MARISKSKSTTEQAPAKGTRKVGRVAKATEQAPAKAKAPAKGRKAASAQQAPAKAPARKSKAASSQQRARIANGTLRLTPEGKAHPGYRGARGECWALVAANNGKPAANVIGQPYTGRDGTERYFDGSFIAFFRDEGLVTVE